MLFAAAAICSIGLSEPDHEAKPAGSNPQRDRVTPDRESGRHSVLTGSPEDYGRTIAADTEKWTKVVQFSGAKVN